MTAQIFQMPTAPDPDVLRAEFHKALAALLSAYEPIVELGDPEVTARLGYEVLLEYRQRLASAAGSTWRRSTWCAPSAST